MCQGDEGKLLRTGGCSSWLVFFIFFIFCFISAPKEKAQICPCCKGVVLTCNCPKTHPQDTKTSDLSVKHSAQRLIGSSEVDLMFFF